MIPAQIAMIAKITTIYGLEVNKSMMTAIVTSTLGAGGATLAGKAVVSNLLKFIPGIGDIVGGAISATTGFALTAALGHAYIRVMEMMVSGEFPSNALESKEGKDMITQMFKEELKLGHKAPK